MSNHPMSKTEILNAVAAGEMTVEQGSQLLNAMATPKPLTLKVSPKGALSVYGLQRMPVTLYADQWERLFAAIDEMQDFAEANDHRLKRKDNLKRESLPGSESFEA
jgi:hypothetical protein